MGTIPDAADEPNWLNHSTYDLLERIKSHQLTINQLTNEQLARVLEELLVNQEPQAVPLRPGDPLERQPNPTQTAIEQANEWIERTWAADERVRLVEALHQSERKYRTLFNEMDQGYMLIEVLLDETGKPNDYRVLEINLHFERLTGLSAEAYLSGKTVGQLMPEHEVHWFQRYGQIALSGEPMRFEDQFASLDRWYDIYAFRLGDPQQRQVALFYNEITERKHREANRAFLADIATDMSRLSTAEEIMTTVGAKVGAYLRVKTCLFVDVDDARGEVTVFDAWNSTEVPSLRYQTIRLSDFINDEFSRANRTGEGAIVRDTQTDPRSEGGDYSALGISAFVTIPFHRNGVWTNYLAVTDSQPHDWRDDEIEVFRELANRVFPRLERARAEAALQEEYRRKDEFLAMLSHELRNPLSTLHNALLLLNLTQGVEESLSLERALAMMSREVGHLNRMVDDLLDVSRIGQGKVQLKKGRIDFHKLVRDTLEAARAEFTRRGQRLTASLASGPIGVEGDSTRLAQVVRNLLTNSAKYTPTGGQIEVSLTLENRQVVLGVRDTGIGLAADHLQVIFEVFVQVNSSLDRPQGGLGLGLAVVKQLVELHGGSIAVESPGVGKGSTFTVRLPSLADLPALDPMTSASNTSAKASQRILVVDDNADLALTTMMILTHNHYEAHMRLSGPDALKAVEGLNPAAVLLDLGMPGMDGFETARRLRALPWGKQGVIVALSGYGQEEDKKQTQAAGFNGHLVKPINLALLTEVLTRLLDPEQLA